MTRPFAHSLLRLATTAGIAGTLLASSGCGDEGPGTLIVPYVLGANLDCEERDVTEVRAVLDDEYDATVDCEVGEVTLSDVPPGKYDLVVEAIASDGVVIMDNLDNDARKVEVVGDGASITLDDAVLLTDAPAKILLLWNFGASNCSNAGIDEFDVTVFADATEVLTEETLDCTNAEADADGYRELPDSDRAINGKTVTDVLVEAPGTSASFNFEPPGPGRAVRLDLECGNDGCQAVEP